MVQKDVEVAAPLGASDRQRHLERIVEGPDCHGAFRASLRLHPGDSSVVLRPARRDQAEDIGFGQVLAELGRELHAQARALHGYWYPTVARLDGEANNTEPRCRPSKPPPREHPFLKARVAINTAPHVDRGGEWKNNHKFLGPAPPHKPHQLSFPWMSEGHRPDRSSDRGPAREAPLLSRFASAPGHNQKIGVILQDTYPKGQSETVNA